MGDFDVEERVTWRLFYHILYVIHTTTQHRLVLLLYATLDTIAVCLTTYYYCIHTTVYLSTYYCYIHTTYYYCIHTTYTTTIYLLQWSEYPVECAISTLSSACRSAFFASASAPTGIAGWRRMKSVKNQCMSIV